MRIMEYEHSDIHSHSPNAGEESANLLPLELERSGALRVLEYHNYNKFP
jgi:hypothetical protein